MDKESLFTLLKTGSLRTLKQRQELIDLTSNDYLGMARDPTFQREAAALWQTWSEMLLQKVGSTGSRLLTGNHRYFEETEAKIAALHGFEEATLFNCGYMANLALLSTLCREDDTLLADLEVHASLHDGMRLSKGKKLFFRHNDLDHLEQRLKQQKGRCFVVVESLYSMSGDYAPLKQISVLCEHYGAHLIVDEAHAIGICGARGEGRVAELGLERKIFACTAGFGKAVGAHGGLILSSSLVKKGLLNFARPLIYTTALPLPNLAAIACSYDRFPKMHKERKSLRELLNTFNIPSPIHPIPAAGNARAKLISHYLAFHGFDVRAILSPTVKRGKERLRLVLHAFNEVSEVKSCMQKIQAWSNR